MRPFHPRNATQYIKSLLAQVHQQFINAVKAGRGDRLKETPDMFSGLVWTGEEGLKNGLADEVGTDDSVAKDLIGAEKQVDFTHQEKLLDRIAGKLGASFGQAISSMAQAPSLR